MYISYYHFSKVITKFRSTIVIMSLPTSPSFSRTSSPLPSPSALPINPEATAQPWKTNDNSLPPINRVNINMNQNDTSHLSHPFVPTPLCQWPAVAGTASGNTFHSGIATSAGNPNDPMPGASQNLFPNHMTPLPHELGHFNPPQQGTVPHYHSLPQTYMNQHASHNFQMPSKLGQSTVNNRMSHPPSKTASGGSNGDGGNPSEAHLSPELEKRLREQMQVINRKI